MHVTFAIHLRYSKTFNKLLLRHRVNTFGHIQWNVKNGEKKRSSILISRSNLKFSEPWYEMIAANGGRKTLSVIVPVS
jgi:hypothetical protein